MRMLVLTLLTVKKVKLIFGLPVVDCNGRERDREKCHTKVALRQDENYADVSMEWVAVTTLIYGCIHAKSVFCRGRLQNSTDG